MPAFRPGKPHIILGLSADISYPGSTTPIPFDVVDHSEGWPHAPAVQGEITVPRTGLYVFGFSWSISTPSASTRLDWQTIHNGAIGYPRDTRGGSADAQRGAVTVIRALLEGDTLHLKLLRVPSATFTIGAPSTKMFCARFGPERWTG